MPAQPPLSNDPAREELIAKLVAIHMEIQDEIAPLHAEAPTELRLGEEIQIDKALREAMTLSDQARAARERLDPDRALLDYADHYAPKFWSRVKISTACWIWEGATAPKTGQALFQFRRRGMKAMGAGRQIAPAQVGIRRAAWLLATRQMIDPSSSRIYHTIMKKYPDGSNQFTYDRTGDHLLCCNPRHLVLVAPIYKKFAGPWNPLEPNLRFFGQIKKNWELSPEVRVEADLLRAARRILADGN